jgi:hypothetical protein
MKLTKRETATVLAALRNWQQDLQEGGLVPKEDFPHHFESDEPLNTKEIDDLCRRINFQGEGDHMVKARSSARVVTSLRTSSMNANGTWR